MEMKDHKPAVLFTEGTSRNREGQAAPRSLAPPKARELKPTQQAIDPDVQESQIRSTIMLTTRLGIWIFGGKQSATCSGRFRSCSIEEKCWERGKLAS